MPVRAIKKIETHWKADLHIPLPSCISDVYKLNDSDVLICEFGRYFGKDKKLIRDIKTSDKLHLGSYCDSVDLAGSPVVQQYGLVADDYIEVIFNTIETRTYESGPFRAKEIKTTVPIFPERTVEDLDFTPE